MNTDEYRAHETECRIYMRELFETIVASFWDGGFNSDSAYVSLFRRTIPRLDVRDSWLAISSGAVDIGGYEWADDPGRLYEVMEGVIALVRELPRDADGPPPAWPVNPQAPEETLTWLSDLERYLGLGSFMEALAAGVPSEDILTQER